MYLRKRSLFYILIVSYINLINSKLLIPLNTNNLSFIYEKLENIINQCFWNDRNSVIVSKEVSQHLKHKYPTLKSTILINSSFSPSRDYQHYPKLITFILDANSMYQLKNTLEVLNSTTWWHVDSYYILVRSNGSCDDISTLLPVIWHYKVLSAIFLCYENQKDFVTMYTYNPFANRAPQPWTFVGNDKLNKHWFLFKRPYLPDPSVCLNLIFDKIKFMDGYKLNVMIIPKPGSIWSPDITYNLSSIIDRVPIHEIKFFLALFQVWNVTISIHYNSTLYHLRKDYYPSLILMPLFLTTWEMTMVIPAYPIRQVSIAIITQKRHFLSPEDKIISFYSRGVILLSIVSFVIALIALMLNRKQRISSALLEIFRLLVFCGIEQPLTELPIRIFFFGIFWLATIINATFQGNLATFLTKPERRNIETLADLVEYNYNVYMYPQYYNHFQESFQLINNSLRLTILLNGYEFVLNNSNAAYIISTFRGYYPAFKHQLHVSKPFLFDYVTISVVKPRFPFVSRINQISLRCLESGLISLWDSQAVEDYRKNLTITEAMETAPRFRPISLADLLFSFKILAIGLGCSILVFVKEIYFYRCGKEKEKIHKRIEKSSSEVNCATTVNETN